MHSHGLHTGHGHSHAMHTGVDDPMIGMMIGWILMVLAMMLPKLIGAVEYIYQRSLKRRQLDLSVLFVLGYAMVWTVVGYLMNMLILALKEVMPQAYMPALLIGLIALIWQASPIKQHFLNLGHAHRPLNAFGYKASLDAWLFGTTHGMYCVGSGWALMLFPMLLTEGHQVAMLFVAVIMISEHMEHPRVPRWRIDFRVKLMRVLVAQTKIRLKQGSLTPKWYTSG
ncbi:DUF2182 domain-containing protein [Lunatimonas sp.]|uniref:copper chaperone n=1 Tax=Lunatimonas sp. TaxID=2060141 RepID=UPI00263AA97F|nr:DUF2182 domain-containing protein [Lunatimonas sp.]